MEALQWATLLFLIVLTIFLFFFFFFFNDTATTEIYTLSLHDALPICHFFDDINVTYMNGLAVPWMGWPGNGRSEEHTSELQSRLHLVCRLLLEKKKNKSESPTALCTTCTLPRLGARQTSRPYRNSLVF